MRSRFRLRKTTAKAVGETDLEGGVDRFTGPRPGPSGCSSVWSRAPALGAGGRRFKSVRPDLDPLCSWCMWADHEKRLAYVRRYQREWIAKRRQDWIDENGPCAKCGSAEDLEVDHVDPSSKMFNPAAIWSLSRRNPVRVAELAKCQVLCYSCHLTKTGEYSGWNREASHGTSTRYSRGCRCQECRNEVTRQKREWRARTGKK